MIKITKRRIIKATKFLILGGIAYTILGFGLSTLFPRQIFFVDNLRLYLQSKGLGALSQYNIEGDQYKALTTESEELQHISQKLKPGDIIFTETKGFLSNGLISGKRKHSAIYLGTKDEVKNFLGKNNTEYQKILTKYKNGDEILILDSNKHGTDIRDIRYLTHLEAIAGIRINRDQYAIRDFILKALENRGKKYDMDFDLEHDDTIFCSELIFDALEYIGLLLPKNQVLTRNVIYPNEIMQYIVQHGFERKQFTFLLYLDSIQEKTKYYNSKTLKKVSLKE